MTVRLGKFVPASHPLRPIRAWVNDALAGKRGLLSGEHFSVDGTLIQAWASHKSVRRKDGSDGDRPPEDWHGEPRSNDTHQSRTDDEISC